MKMNGSIEKMLKDVVKGASAARPELQCAHFEGGSIVVTDSHRLVRVSGLAPKGLKMDLNLADFSFPKINYPDTRRLIPQTFRTAFRIDKHEAIKLLPALKAMCRDYNSVVQLVVVDTRLGISQVDKKSGNTQTISLKVEDLEGETQTISCNPIYLYEALDALAKFPDKRIRWIEMKINSDLTPFLLCIKNIEYLLTPVKVF